MEFLFSCSRWYWVNQVMILYVVFWYQLELFNFLPFTVVCLIACFSSLLFTRMRTCGCFARKRERGYKYLIEFCVSRVQASIFNLLKSFWKINLSKIWWSNRSEMSVKCSRWPHPTLLDKRFDTYLSLTLFFDRKAGTNNPGPRLKQLNYKKQHLSPLGPGILLSMVFEVQVPKVQF